MVDTVRVKFTAKPGLYPPHKGGRTWLHARATVQRTPHESASDGFTTKVVPAQVLQSGDVIEVDAETANTLTSRYQCFQAVEESSRTPASKKTRSDA